MAKVNKTTEQISDDIKKSLIEFLQQDYVMLYEAVASFDTPPSIIPPEVKIKYPSKFKLKVDGQVII